VRINVRKNENLATNAFGCDNFATRLQLKTASKVRGCWRPYCIIFKIGPCNFTWIAGRTKSKHRTFVRY
jgi:hypothetical protein